ncbi:MAG: outer membrane beta-barrel protein [Kiritimatiellia bacterium]
MKTAQCLLAMLVAVTLATGVNANTLDRRMISINAGIVQLGGDADKMFSDYIDDIYTYGVAVQLPMNDYFSLLGGIQRTTTSLNADGVKGDITGLGFSGGVRLQIPIEDMPITPFAAAQYGHNVGEFETSFEGEKIKAEQTTGAITLSAGVEWSLSERLSLMATYSRVSEQSSDLKVNGEKIDLDEVDTDSTNVLSASVSFWMSDNVLLSGLFAVEQEEKTKTIQAAIGFAF